jgi:Transglycosylase-like domain
MPGTGLDCARSFLVRTAAPLVFTVLAVCAAPVVAAIPIHAEGGAWSVVARCESGGNWNIGTGVAYVDGPRFSPVADPARAASPGQAPDGAPGPRTGPVHTQVLVAERVLRSQGIRAWPRCSSAAPGGGLRADQSGLTDPPTR